MAIKNIDRMNEVLQQKYEVGRTAHRRGGIRFLGWGFKDLTNAAVARDFCAIEKARANGNLKSELVTSFGF